MRFLKALAAAALLFIAAPALAQTQTSLMGCCAMGPATIVTGGGGGGYVGPGDVISGATVWLGLRAYNAAAAASNARAVKLVRTDTHACDVLLSTSGGLGNTANCSTTGDNGTAVATWCAATTCSIDIFYDQSGNTRDFTESARATLVFNCIGTLPCADFAGTSWYSNFSMTALSQPFTTSTVAIRTGAFAAQNDLFDVGAGSFFGPSANQVGGFWGATGVATASDSVWHAIQIVTSGSSSAVAVDATQTTGLNMGTVANPSPTLWLGTQASGGSNPFTGKLTEIAIWPSAFSGAQQTSICANQHAYWGTPTSC